MRSLSKMKWLVVGAIAVFAAGCGGSKEPDLKPKASNVDASEAYVNTKPEGAKSDADYAASRRSGYANQRKNSR